LLFYPYRPDHGNPFSVKTGFHQQTKIDFPKPKTDSDILDMAGLMCECCGYGIKAYSASPSGFESKIEKMTNEQTTII